MKISIEIDGVAIELPDARPPVPVPPATEPPPELLAAARLLGARSAGVAAFSMPEGGRDAFTAPATIVPADANAGPAPGFEPAPGTDAQPRKPPRRPRTKR